MSSSWIHNWLLKSQWLSGVTMGFQKKGKPHRALSKHSNVLQGLQWGSHWLEMTKVNRIDFDFSDSRWSMWQLSDNEDWQATCQYWQACIGMAKQAKASQKYEDSGCDVVLALCFCLHIFSGLHCHSYISHCWTTGLGSSNFSWVTGQCRKTLLWLPSSWCVFLTHVSSKHLRKLPTRSSRSKFLLEATGIFYFS